MLRNGNDREIWYESREAESHAIDGLACFFALTIIEIIDFESRYRV